MEFQLIAVLICASMALISIIGLYQAAKHERARNKKLADELESRKSQFVEMRNDRDQWKTNTHNWVDQYNQRGETLGNYRKEIAEVEEELDKRKENFEAALMQLAKLEAQSDDQIKQIAELEKELEQTIESKKRWARSAAEYAKEQRTAWAVHQVVTVYGKPRIVCLSAVVFAETEDKAKMQFVDISHETYTGLKVRSISPVQANKVFPNI